MTRPRALAAVCAAVVGLALVASCTSIPSDGAIRSNEVTAGAPQGQFIRVLARPPRAGASQTEIVAGFLTASASFDNGHAVARSYLTSEASTTWLPDLKVAVYDSDQGYRLAPSSPQSVQMLGLRAAGSIGARGQFRQPVPNSRLRADFKLTRIAGQWRISVVPQGLILSTGDVARAYRTLNLYFLDVTGGVLVPDPVALPAGQPGSATSLVRELLLGPTPWLAPAVHTSIPVGTKLAVDAVPVENGIARVDLDTRAVAATGDDRRSLAAQLTYTLAQLPDVVGVRITLSGVPFAIPGIGAVSRVSDWENFDPNAPPLDPNAYALGASGLGVIGAKVQPVAGWFGKAKGLSAAAVALNGGVIAGVDPTGAGSEVRLGVAGAERTSVAYRGTDVTSLSFDRFSSTWLADRRGRSTVVSTVRSDRAAAPVTVRGLGTRTVDALRVSRDGARIAMVVSPAAGGDATLLLGRIERSTGLPTVAGLRRVESALTDVADVSWADDVTLLVVARRGSEPLQSFTVGIDGDSLRSSGAVPGMRSVAASPGAPFLAGTTTGVLWADRGNGWRSDVRGGEPIYPG